MKHIKEYREFVNEQTEFPAAHNIDDTVTFIPNEGADHLHRPITGTYQPSSLDESKIGDIYIMAAEAPNFPAFKKEFVKEYGEVKGSKEEKDLNAWLKNVWDERPTNEAAKEKEVYKGLKLDTKYHQTTPIKDLGFELTDDEEVKPGDIIWNEYTGKLTRAKHQIDAGIVKNSMNWKVKEPK